MVMIPPLSIPERFLSASAARGPEWTATPVLLFEKIDAELHTKRGGKYREDGGRFP
jgi:hypothetical protein